MRWDLRLASSCCSRLYYSSGDGGAYMILLWLIVIPLVGGVISLLAARRSVQASRWIAIATTGTSLALTAGLWISAPEIGATPSRSRGYTSGINPGSRNSAFASIWRWTDLSLVLLLLTFFLGLMSVIASWTEIQDRVGFFHFNLLWVLAGITGVFLAVDLFLFYLFWELMLVPMYFLIGIWGHERRVYAAIKFFLFTQLSGLLMLAAIVTLAVLYQKQTGSYSFDYQSLKNLPLTPGMARLLMLGFFAAFAVKLPAFPVHTWLPDAHTEAPTAGSVILAGLLLKTGAYGLIRFVLPLFPGPVHDFAPAMMTLGVIGVLYGAFLAVSQHDFKRLVAYTSVSHMGFVLIGIFAGNETALTGAFIHDGEPWHQHRSFVHTCGRFAATAAYPRDPAHGRFVDTCAGLKRAPGSSLSWLPWDCRVLAILSESFSFCSALIGQMSVLRPWRLWESSRPPFTG